MIHVAFNIDENYLDKVKVVIKSILANTKEEVTFHIVGANIFMPNVNIKCYENPDLKRVPQIKNFGEITVAAGYRLFLPEIIKEDKVIYLDCDLIVLQDIAELWKYTPKYIAGVVDPMFKMHKDKVGVSHTYINSGVMVMNLKGLREFDFVTKCTQIDTSKYTITLPDQDIINAVLDGKIQHIPYKWNVYAKIYDQTTEGMAEARNNPAIIHWVGVKKPWKHYLAWKEEEYLKFT